MLAAALAACRLAAAQVTVIEASAPARDWRHSSLTGNGTLGAMVEGHVADELIHLSHARLYMPMDPELDKGARDPFMAASRPGRTTAGRRFCAPESASLRRRTATAAATGAGCSRRGPTP